MPAHRIPLVYVLHSSNLYGTERMALDTLNGLQDEFAPILMGPPGPAMDEAERLGFAAVRFRGPRAFAKMLRPILRDHARLTFVATSVVQASICILLNSIYRRRINHLQIVHGGGKGNSGYGRKKWLNEAYVRFVTVSSWAKDQLIAAGARADRIVVIPNFIPRDRLAKMPRRTNYELAGVKKVLVVARMDPMKRVDLLLDALDLRKNELADISFKIVGLGPDMKTLSERAARSHPNVSFPGFCPDVAAEMAQADLLVHTCPVESFGLSVLEAMACNLAVLVPNAGGAGLQVNEGVNGFRFIADNATSLAQRLIELENAPPDLFNHVVAGGRVNLEQAYSAERIIQQYREVFRLED